MSEPGKEQPANQSFEVQLAEAEKLLEEIRKVRGQTEEQFKAAETARSKADTEALLAFNAKNACEGHATSIAGIKGNVDVAANSISTTKQHADELVAALNSAKANLDVDLKTIGERRKEVDQSASEIIKASESGAARLTEVDASKVEAETAAKSTAEALKAATKANEGAGKAQKEAEQASGQASSLAMAASQNQSVAKEMADNIASLLQQAQASEANLKKVLDHLTHSDEISTGHEGRVKESSKQLEELIERVEGLLPGATSAGLASSFSKQKSRFEPQQSRWLWTFVGCISGLVVIAFPSFLSAIGINLFGHVVEQTWDATLRNLALRLPIVLPLVWLAIYAGRNYMLAMRLEEDYAYKEAISTAFEGYKREMEKIVTGDIANPTPIAILSTNILRAIAERPGRIYESKHQDINLMTEAKSLAEKGAELSKKNLAAS
jgi:chromosome segregation ATPase